MIIVNFNPIEPRTYFWRTRQQQEMDFVEDNNGKVFGFEFKWQKKKTQKLPKSFTETYNAEANIIDRENFREFVKI